jgi:zinc D-Ala-D-Ala carboxypeptidase
MAQYFTPETDPRLFFCPCQRPECDAPMPSLALLQALDRIRSYVNMPVIVTSGVRCEPYNASIGGARDSAHLTGDAADLAAPTPTEMDALVEASYAAGIMRRGVYQDGHLHVDVSITKALHVLWVK